MRSEAYLLLVATAFVASCGDSHMAAPALGPVMSHRPEAVPCGSSDAGTVPMLNDLYPRGPNGETLSCTKDEDCPPCANGLPDRCHTVAPVTGTRACICDQCITDQQCGGVSVCGCGGSVRYPAGSLGTGNFCASGGCSVDADCGPGGMCSPTVDWRCGGIHGITGYYCHSAHDLCNSDLDCTGDATCRFYGLEVRWKCASTMCSD